HAEWVIHRVGFDDSIPTPWWLGTAGDEPEHDGPTVGGDRPRGYIVNWRKRRSVQDHPGGLGLCSALPRSLHLISQPRNLATNYRVITSNLNYRCFPGFEGGYHYMK